MSDSRQLRRDDLSKVIPWMMILSFEHGILWVRVEQRNHSTMAAKTLRYIPLIACSYRRLA